MEIQDVKMATENGNYSFMIFFNNFNEFEFMQGTIRKVFAQKKRR